MKKLRYFTMLATMLFLGSFANAHDAHSNTAPIKFRVVNFKTCAEQSKMGKQEQVSFEALKKQMENVLLEREKVLNDMAKKFEDEDYLDSLSPEAETEMKRKFRTLNQEYTQLQQQYLQTLQQTNYKVVQKLSDEVSKASDIVAKNSKIDMILNDETVFFASPSLDISAEVVKVMDETFEREGNSPEAKDVE